MATSESIQISGVQEVTVPVDAPPPYPAHTPAEPPPYQANAPPGHTSDSPPSYDTIFGQVRAAKEESNSVIEFFKKMGLIFLGTLGCTACIGLVLAIPISMIVIGGIHLNDCNAERYIPIYLIVAGVFGVLKDLSAIVQHTVNRCKDNNDENAKTNPLDSLLNCFLLAWFIAGNVWIYRTYGNFTTSNPAASNYCHPTLYYFAFWITTATHILMGLTCLCICGGGLLAGVLGVGKGNADQNLK